MLTEEAKEALEMFKNTKITVTPTKKIIEVEYNKDSNIMKEEKLYTKEEMFEFAKMVINELISEIEIQIIKERKNVTRTESLQFILDEYFRQEAKKGNYRM